MILELEVLVEREENMERTRSPWREGVERALGASIPSGYGSVGGFVYSDGGKVYLRWEAHLRQTPEGPGFLVERVNIEDQKSPTSFNRSGITSRIPNVLSRYGLLFEEMPSEPNRFYRSTRTRQLPDFGELTSVREEAVIIEPDKVSLVLGRLNGNLERAIEDVAKIARAEYAFRHVSEADIEVTGNKISLHSKEGLSLRDRESVADVIDSLLNLAVDGRYGSSRLRKQETGAL